MTMIQLRDRHQLATAINKAREVKPRVHVDCFGSYTVENKTTDARYNVARPKRDGKRFAHCTCKAGERGQACYHLAAAVSAHIQLASERAPLEH